MLAVAKTPSDSREAVDDLHGYGEAISERAEFGKLLIPIGSTATDECLHAFGVEACMAPANVMDGAVFELRLSIVAVPPDALGDFWILDRGESLLEGVCGGALVLLVREGRLDVLEDLVR
jgi:hypothetical protein